MAEWKKAPIKTIAICVSATLATLGVGLFLFAASGIYNVAANRGHFAVTRWMLEFAMRRSVATHSSPISAPPLQDADKVRLGAGHYEGGCAPCHGAPGKQNNPFVREMLPRPPDLSEAVTTWAAEELYWIVQNGLKYTGMPAWVAPRRDDEIWAVVAFLRVLPNMNDAEYRRLADGNAERQTRGAREIARSGSASGSSALTACIRCHGDETASPTSRLVPKLAGQSPRYLETALEDYAAGLRQSGIMQPVAAELDKAEIAGLAEYYAGLSAHRANSPLAKTATEQIERGRMIATAGVQTGGIPPCVACHDRGSPAVFPRLAGQYAQYLVGQLRLWRNGLRDRTARGAIMASIARRLTDQQIEDVAAYFASLAPGPAGAVSRSDAGDPVQEALP